MTKSCGSCSREVADDALYCSGCGQRLQEEPVETLATPAASSPVSSEQHDWVKFLGPASKYYLQQFEKFRREGGDQFALTWNWYSFLLGWLWFLYRKMYLYAAVFAVGPFLTVALLRGGMEILFMWGIAAGGLANYLYYGHVKRNLVELHSQPRVPGDSWDHTLSDVGGVQPYVWWLGVGIVVMALVLGVINPPQEHPPPNQPALLEDVRRE